MKGYKGFSKGLICRGKQYAENTIFTEDSAKICESGMHFCENPFEIWGYYPPCNGKGELNEFAEVVSLAETKTDDNKKFCTTKLKIGVKLSFTDFVKAGVEFLLEKSKDNTNANTGNRSAATNTGKYSAATNMGDYSAATNTGNRSAATNMGDYSTATNTGYYSAATNTGNRSAATNTGKYSAATNTGNRSAATNMGDYSTATNTGNRSAATNTGDYSAATNTGNRSAATNMGDYSTATNTGKYSAATNMGDCSAATNMGDYSTATNMGDYSTASVEGISSIAICIGNNGKAKGSLGCWIACAERGTNYEVVNFKTAKVDGEIIKADTYYALKGGKFVECEED